MKCFNVVHCSAFDQFAHFCYCVIICLFILITVLFSYHLTPPLSSSLTTTTAAAVIKQQLYYYNYPTKKKKKIQQKKKKRKNFGVKTFRLGVVAFLDFLIDFLFYTTGKLAHYDVSIADTSGIPKKKTTHIMFSKHSRF